MDRQTLNTPITPNSVAYAERPRGIQRVVLDLAGFAFLAGWIWLDLAAWVVAVVVVVVVVKTNKV